MSGARAVIITEMSHTNDCSIEMVDDDTDEETNIPAGFLMGKSGRMIIKTLEKLKRSYAIINIPVNLTFTPIHKMNQPPWIKWQQENTSVQIRYTMSAYLLFYYTWKK